MESSLTSPSDRNRENKWRPNQTAPPLTNTEVNTAINELNNTTFVKKFPKVERRYADPSVELQKYGLISFIPAKGATPNPAGVYGFAKLRGNYNTTTECNERAEYLIRNVDSYHQIYHAYVGRPFPLTTSSKYSEETDEVDLRKTMTESVSDNIKKKKREEKKVVEEIQERENMLKEDVNPDIEDDPIETYTTLRVKFSQISWTYKETEEKLKEMQEIIIKTKKQIDAVEEKNPEFRNQYFEKYMKARKDAGMKDDSHIKNSFMKFLVEDAEFDFLPKKVEDKVEDKVEE